jgi:hypothetical protein
MENKSSHQAEVGSTENFLYLRYRAAAQYVSCRVILKSLGLLPFDIAGGGLLQGRSNLQMLEAQAKALFNSKPEQTSDL